MWQELSLSLLAIISFLQAGLVADYYLLRGKPSWSNLPIYFGLGIGLVGFCQIIAGLVGIRLSQTSVLSASLLVFTPYLLERKLRLFIASASKITLPHSFLILLPFFFIIGSLAFAHIIWGYDAYAFWLSKARAFWVDGLITRENLYAFWPWDQPILWPMQATWFYHILGRADGFWVQFIPLSVLVMLIFWFAVLVFKEKKKWRHLWLFLLLLTPFLWGQLAFAEYAGNADLLVSFFLLLAVSSIIGRKTIYAAIFLGLAFYSKNDALPALAGFIFFLPLVGKNGKTRFPASWWLAVFFLGSHLAWKYYFGLSNRYLGQNLIAIARERPILPYIWYTLHAFREEFRQINHWGAGWWLIIFTLVLKWRVFLKDYLLRLGLILVGAQFLGYVWAYYVTVENPASQISTSIFRLALQIYPALVFLAYKAAAKLS